MRGVRMFLRAATRTQVFLAPVMCALGCWLALPGTAGAAWNQPTAAPLNFDPTGDAFDPSITTVGGSPYLAWDEIIGTARRVHVDQLTDGGWATVGGSLNIDSTKKAELPSIASIGGTPYVAWDEKDGGAYQVHVAEFTGGAWNPVGGSLNIDPTKNAGSASIADVGGIPYVAWAEANGATSVQIRVARLSGGGWSAVGGSLNVDPTKQALNPRITTVAGIPYVTWQELVGTHDDVFVKRFVGGAWSAVGGPLNVDATEPAELPSITDVGGIPYVAWFEGSASASQVHVAQFTGAGWRAVGGALNLDPTEDAGPPSITNAGGIPFVTWNESNAGVSQIRVAQFKEGAWTTIGGSLNADPAHGADLAVITMVAGTPYVAWEESGASVSEIRAARLEPDVLSETAIPSATGATLTAHVNDYGVPLPVGFEYGTTTALGNATTPQSTAGTGTSTVTQTVSGLAPTTTYFYRAFGSDGFRETSPGAIDSFTTLALPAAGPAISKLTVSPSKFSLSGRRVDGHCVRATKKNSHDGPCRRTISLRVSYALNVAARVILTLKQQAPGRRTKGRCLRPTKTNRKGKSCTRLIRLRGSIVKNSSAGVTRFTFNGTLGGHALGPGTYLLIATPGGGQPKRARFKIVS